MGRTNSCGMYEDGSVECWGDNSNDISTIPAVSDISEVALGYEDTCIIYGSDNTIECWGANFDSSMDDYNGATGYQNIDVSYRHACAQEITTGEVHCWGALNKGAINDSVLNFNMGTSTDHYIGIYSATEEAFTKGNNQFGELLIPSGSWSYLVTETAHSCGIRRNGAIQCWGNNTYGETVVPEL